jgi:type II secretory pathway pseudopilin PulG
MPRAPAIRHQAGFTYLGLIILVTLIGLVGAATLKVGVLLQRAAAEEELLAIGAAFSDALQSYAAVTPPGQPQQPPTLQDLLKDPRFPGTRRHLRKLFVDPLTGKAEWGVLYQGDKVGVLAVYSLSEAKPLKIANFDARFQNFENKEHLSEWKFTANGQGLVQKVHVTSTPSGAGPRFPGRLRAPAPVPEPVPEPVPDTPVEVPVPAEPPQAPPPAEPAEPAEPPEPAEPEAPVPSTEPAVAPGKTPVSQAPVRTIDR